MTFPGIFSDKPTSRCNFPKRVSLSTRCSPLGTFVPTISTPTKTNSSASQEGEFDIWLDGKEFKANAGDLVRMPTGSLHGIFNNSGGPTHALFWVTPSQRLYDLFVQLNNLADPAEVMRISTEYNVHFKKPQN